MEARRRVVREIPAILNPSLHLISEKKRVTFYARVSTDFDAQEESFDRQQEHFKDLIKVHDDWEFVEGYADQGITGTKAEARPAFMQMIQDARENKFDRILVKSISRFARNTVDTLKYIRELKELGIGVYFETQGIDTLTSNGEVLITILAAMAEQESRTISTNVKWSYQKRFKDGEVLINSNMMGYKKVNGKYTIVEDEAKIIRQIFTDYAAGMTVRDICSELRKNDVKTRKGKYFKPETVIRILENEKYTGNAVLGKTYKADVLSKRRVKNKGQGTMYYVENSHPAIISQELFDRVNNEKQRRVDLKTNENTGTSKYSSKYPLSGLLVCGNCGSKFRRHSRTLASGEKVPIWVDTNHQRNHDACPMLPLKEKDIMEAYERVIKKYSNDIEEIITQTWNNINEVLSLNDITELTDIQNKLFNERKQMITLFEDRRMGKIEDTEYNMKYLELSNKVKDLEIKEASLNSNNINNDIKETKLRTIKSIIENKDIDINEPSIIRELIDVIKVIDKHTLEFQFSCGLKVIEQI